MKTFFKWVGIIIVAFIVLGIFAGAGSDKGLEGIKTDVASDFERQYNEVKVHGSKVDVCVRAGLVAEGYLQAGDTDNYGKWKAIEKADCAAAGVPK